MERAMDDFDKLLNKNLKNPKFKDEWEKLQLRSRVIDLLVEIRHTHNLTQKELAEKLGTTQAVISRIENGSVNVGIDFLSKLAKTFSKQIEIKLTDKKKIA